MFDQATDPSIVQTSETSDSDLFTSITGRKLRASRRFLNADSTKLHHAQRRAFEEMPSVAEACGGLVSTVQAEKRRDDKIELRDLHVDDVGALTSASGDIIPGATSIGVLEHGWAQLVARAPRSVPARLRSNVNSWIRNASGTAVLRTLETEGARDAFAIVSERYQAHDADRVASELARAMSGSDLRGQVKYLGSGGRYEIEAVLARPFEIEGDGLHRVIVSVRSSDDGTMSQQIAFKAWRLKCLNGMFIADRQVLKRLWHKGDITRMQEQLADGIAMAKVAMDSFATHWTRARRERFVDAHTGSDLASPEALRRLVGHGHVVVPGVRSKDLVAKLVAAWQVEPGHAVADTLNAVTRAAHTAAWPVAWSTESMEQVAGEILFGRSLGLPALTPKQLDALAA